MSALTDTTRPAPVLGRVLRRGGLVLAALVAVMAVAVLAGGRFGVMLAIGLGLGITLEGLRFGFAGPWRAMILRRESATEVPNYFRREPARDEPVQDPEDLGLHRN